MTPQQFIAKWQSVQLSERSACQQHFLDLCELLEQPKPAAADPEGTWYTFERGVHKSDGGQGWADVWLKDKFGWEYKGKHKDLDAAYAQLLQYREALENPPLLVDDLITSRPPGCLAIMAVLTSGHLYPLTRGGKHEMENVFWMSDAGNRIQGNDTFDEIVALIKRAANFHVKRDR